jgi:hypothetical protein
MLALVRWGSMPAKILVNYRHDDNNGDHDRAIAEYNKAM